jgi:hypothetical protein
VKQILLTMNDKENFIIEDLDDNHLVIKADEEYRVRRELEVEASHPASTRARTSLTHLHAVGEKYVQLGSQLTRVTTTIESLKSIMAFK